MRSYKLNYKGNRTFETKKLEKPEELIGKETATKNQDTKFYPGVINPYPANMENMMSSK
jgi:hypothetical protein